MRSCAAFCSSFEISGYGEAFILRYVNTITISATTSRTTASASLFCCDNAFSFRLLERIVQVLCGVTPGLIELEGFDVPIHEQIARNAASVPLW